MIFAATLQNTVENSESFNSLSSQRMPQGSETCGKLVKN